MDQIADTGLVSRAAQERFSGAWTGAAGLGAAVLAMAVFKPWPQADYLKTLAVLAVAALAMLAVDVMVYRVHQSQSTGLARRPLRAFDALRVLRKLIGFWLTIGTIAFLYWLVPVYADPFFASFKQAALFCLPLLIILAPPYIAWVDRHQQQPVDAYAEVAGLLGGVMPADSSRLAAHARSWAIKAFFIPLMFTYTNNDLATMWGRDPMVPLDSFQHFFAFGIDFLYLMDVLLAVVAYVLTLRIVDTHIRSAEPTLAGWVVCLLCYPPFFLVTGKYLDYDQDNFFWGYFFQDFPIAYVVWGSIILALTAIYAWATAAFGLRFSNLTNRGIITHGPYRWVKHPAYLAKNLSWWMISVPFLTTTDWALAVRCCLLLAGVNAIYWLRAVTEERHLRADPAYRDYEAFIADEGLWAHLKRFAGHR